MLVLCFLLVSVVSRSAGLGFVSSSSNTFYQQKSKDGTKSLIQLLVEEKEGEKGSEKHSTFYNTTQSYRIDSTFCLADFSLKICDARLPSGALPLYLKKRSILI